MKPNTGRAILIRILNENPELFSDALFHAHFHELDNELDSDYEYIIEDIANERNNRLRLIRAGETLKKLKGVDQAHSRLGLMKDEWDGFLIEVEESISYNLEEAEIKRFEIDPKNTGLKIKLRYLLNEMFILQEENKPYPGFTPGYPLIVQNVISFPYLHYLNEEVQPLAMMKYVAEYQDIIANYEDAKAFLKNSYNLSSEFLEELLENWYQEEKERFDAHI